jgi:hypothetical protein
MSSLTNDLVRQFASLNSRRAAPGQANRLISSGQVRWTMGSVCMRSIREGKTRSEHIVFDEIRLAAGEPQEERYERIDRCSGARRSRPSPIRRAAPYVV